MNKGSKPQLPKHVCIIMGGSGRWAREQGLPEIKGYYKGTEVLKEMATVLVKSDIKYVSALIFSTDDWTRPKSEVDYLMKLIVRFLSVNREEFAQNNMRLMHLGSREGLPKSVLKSIDETVRATETCTGGVFALAINYGGQQEIVDACKKLLRQRKDPVRLSAREFEKALYMPDLPPVDLVIRTAADYRTDGFMMWHAAQAEYVFIDKLWPDFSRQDLKFAILYYARKSRQSGQGA